jgi:hypothetical protein
MSFTYGAGTGTVIDTYCVEDTLPAQTDQTGSNTVVVSDDITTLAGATYLGDGTAGNGPGVTYAGRLGVLRIGLPTEETRLITVQTDLGGGATVANSWRLTVSEDWDTVPAVGDTFDVFHTADDVETGTAGSGGVAFQTRTGFFEWSNELFVGGGTNKAGLQILGELWELEDSKSTTVFPFTVRNNGRIQSGYVFGGVGINGGYMTGINNSAGEPWMEFLAGAEARLYDWRPISAIVPLQCEVNNGTNDIQVENFSLYRGTDEAILIDSSWKNGSIIGSGAATDIVRLDAGSTFGDKDKGIALIATNGLYDNGAGTETITTREVTFVNNNNYIVLDDDKTWNMIDPVWGVTSHSDINDTAVAGTAAVYHQTSVTVVVQEADGTKLQDALINVHENTQLDDLVIETTTDANGDASGVFNYRGMTWTTGTGSTTTYGGHALQCGKWLYLPLVFAQSSADKFDGVITLSLDNNIVQTTQATAKTAGSGITWNDETNPSSVVDYTGGSGSPVLAAGDTVTGSLSGASGIVTAFLDGDQAAGTLHLKTRNANNFVTSDVLQRTGGGWTANYTALSEQYFSIWIDGNSLSYQTIYDYLAAIQNETTLTADGELIWEWCRSAQTQPLYATGSSFYTEQSNFKGIIIVNGGAGTVDYFTDDDEGTWVPPATVTLQVTVTNQFGTGMLGVKARYEESDGTLIANGTTNASGVFSVGIDAGLLPYNNAKVIIRDKRFEDPPDTILNITTAGFDLVIGLQPDVDINLP